MTAHTNAEPSRLTPEAERFLASPATRQIIGPRADRYLRSFRRMLEKSGGELPTTWQSIQTGGKFLSWNWAAALLTAMWMLYRRQYAIGILLLLGGFAAALLRAEWLLLVNVCVIILCGLKGDALVLRNVGRRWRELGSPDAALASAPAHVGPTLTVPLIAAAIFVGVGAVTEVGPRLLSSDFNCSSSTAVGLAEQIVREQALPRLSAAFGSVIDVNKSLVRVTNVRTRNSGPKRLECAASLGITMVPVDQFQKPEGWDLYIGKFNAGLANQEITYAVELTDGDGSIYVTVDL